jgi:GTP-binding protein EngB required for normal cell division
MGTFVVQETQMDQQPPATEPNPTKGCSSLIEVAHQLESPRLEREARTLAQRLADKRFFVACLGQFKRGKSSLLNALVGRVVLPTGVVPVTAIVTILRYGPAKAEVHFENGSRANVPTEKIAEFVSEQSNPANSKGVAVVEVFVPSELLASGMCLVDTPGIGSVYAGNTAVTKSFVPHIDAALVVLGADPPISGEELALLEEVAASTDQIVFVLNKADRLTAGERAEGVEFARRTLQETLHRDAPRLFEVSAAEWLDGAGPSRDASLLQAELERLARESAPLLLQLAARRGIERISAALLREIHNQREALIAPVERSQLAAVRIREVIADAERSLSDLSHLFRAEQERVRRRSIERRDAFLARTIPAARREFHDAILQARERRGSQLHGHATEMAQTISRRLLDQWLKEQRPAAETMYRQSADRFVKLANEFLIRMARSGDPSLSDLPQAVSEESGFRVRGRLYYGEHFGFPRQTIREQLVGMLSGRSLQVARIETQVARYIDTLLSLNSTRILNDFDEIIRESGRRLEAEIRQMLNDLRAAAETTLARAEATHAAGSAAIEARLRLLEELRCRVESRS